MECEHLVGLEPVPPRTPGCEECLKTGSSWSISAFAWSVVMSGVATVRPADMPRATFVTPGIRWSLLLSLGSVGHGATWISCS